MWYSGDVSNEAQQLAAPDASSDSHALVPLRRGKLVRWLHTKVIRCKSGKHWYCSLSRQAPLAF